jgi:SAM-dependent methyltransferase
VFQLGDATRSALPGARFDAVICVFGAFFAADMPAFVREMVRLLRPGGTLAITTWGPSLFEPATSVFWDAVRRVDATLVRTFNPWDAVTSETALTNLLAHAGVQDATAHAVAGTHRLADPAAFWDVVLGSGYRATIDALGPARASDPGPDRPSPRAPGGCGRSVTTEIREPRRPPGPPNCPRQT